MNDPQHPDPTPLQLNLVERVNVGDILTRTADVHPQSVALVDGERRLSYAELDRQVTRLGHALLGLGLQAQDVVGVMSRNTSELLLTYFACARAGLVCAPVNLGLQAEEIAWCLRDAKARVLITERALGAQAASVQAEPMPDLAHRFWIDAPPAGGAGQGHGTALAATATDADPDPAGDSFDALLARGSDAPLERLIADRDAVQLLYTSGTTSRPKGVLTSHLAVTMAALSNAIAHQCVPGFSALVTLPLFHCAMLNSVVMPLMATGGRVVLVKAFEAAQAADLFEHEAINTVVLLPMMYGQLLDHPVLRTRRFPAMRRALYAMAPLAQERLQAIHDMFPNADVVLGSGQTEFTPATCLQRPDHQWTKAATWGTATTMTRVAIMADDGRLLPRGETGEIVYRGPQLMNGYLNQPELSRHALRHGWFHSGDVAHIDDDGAIWFTDRSKDVIKTGGENVASIEVERCLIGHPAVAEAAVIGAPHQRWGEAVTAVVLLKPGAQAGEAELLAHCRERLSGFKVPKGVVFVTEFPRTGTGKVQKHILRGQFGALYTPNHTEDNPS
jgi:acyl-CoA synthetase (AMP-forming)/AMP-acid ligase II